jgi:sorbitol/mannitol transport system permease protein
MMFKREEIRLADRQTNIGVRLLLGLVTWVIILIFFFPVLWMVLTGLKTETDAGTSTPHFIFKPTFENWSSAWNSSGGRTGLSTFIQHSLITSIGSTLVVLILAFPAAYALSIRPVGAWRDGLFFFISTKMLPIVGAIVPLYVLASPAHLDILDTSRVLIILYTAMNLPIAVWMLRSFLLEVPNEIIEASRVDGAGAIRQMWAVILPIARPGFAATSLICFIFAWNEYFLAVNLTTRNAQTVPTALASFVQPEGPFIAHLSAAATIACLPVLIAGWFAQDKLVRGLSMGAVK